MYWYKPFKIVDVNELKTFRKHDLVIVIMCILIVKTLCDMSVFVWEFNWILPKEKAIFNASSDQNTPIQ